MKLAINLFLSLFALLTFDDKALSLSNYQISKICKKEKSLSLCIKDLQEKSSNLKQGKPIEIPVVPYKQ